MPQRSLRVDTARRSDTCGETPRTSTRARRSAVAAHRAGKRREPGPKARLCVVELQSWNQAQPLVLPVWATTEPPVPTS